MALASFVASSFPPVQDVLTNIADFNADSRSISFGNTRRSVAIWLMNGLDDYVGAIVQRLGMSVSHIGTSTHDNRST
jgi:hypothetical protein